MQRHCRSSRLAPASSLSTSPLIIPACVSPSLTKRSAPGAPSGLWSTRTVVHGKQRDTERRDMPQCTRYENNCKDFYNRVFAVGMPGDHRSMAQMENLLNVLPSWASPESKSISLSRESLTNNCRRMTDICSVFRVKGTQRPRTSERDPSISSNTGEMSTSMMQ